MIPTIIVARCRREIRQRIMMLMIVVTEVLRVSAKLVPAVSPCHRPGHLERQNQQHGYQDDTAEHGAIIKRAFHQAQLFHSPTGMDLAAAHCACRCASSTKALI